MMSGERICEKFWVKKCLKYKNSKRRIEQKQIKIN